MAWTTLWGYSLLEERMKDIHPFSFYQRGSKFESSIILDITLIGSNHSNDLQKSWDNLRKLRACCNIFPCNKNYAAVSFPILLLEV